MHPCFHLPIQSSADRYCIYSTLSIVMILQWMSAMGNARKVILHQNTSPTCNVMFLLPFPLSIVSCSNFDSNVVSSFFIFSIYHHTCNGNITQETLVELISESNWVKWKRSCECYSGIVDCAFMSSAMSFLLSTLKLWTEINPSFLSCFGRIFVTTMGK